MQTIINDWPVAREIPGVGLVEAGASAEVDQRTAAHLVLAPGWIKRRPLPVRAEPAPGSEEEQA